MKIQQHLGIVGAICSSLLVSYGAIAQTTNPTPTDLNETEMERICAEYRNMNDTQAQPSNRTGSTTGNSSTGTSGTTASRNATGNSTGTSGTTASRNATGNSSTSTSGNTASGNTTGNTSTSTSGNTTNRNATGNTRTSTSGNTASGNTTGNTSTGTRSIASFTPEQLDRMCANFMNDSDSDRTTPSAKPGNTTRPNQRPTTRPAPNQQ